MSTISDYERVFVDEEEKTFSTFTPAEQAKLRLGKRTEAIDNKLGVMKFCDFEYESNFRYFRLFLQTIPDGLVGSAPRQFAVMKRFVLLERMMAKPINIEITPEGYIFYEDNLIAL
uniref:WGS project CBMI000000000 data, contig CS3069_c002044 n=1 Tax=Fusarium clavum TaxID=2594811 RepID=A0A090MCA2_9HYPO|nr:unnamed protein product [Fusarium clavum]